MENLIHVISEITHIPVTMIRDKARINQDVSRAKMLFVYIAHNVGNFSASQINDYTGWSRTSVYHLRKTALEYYRVDPSFRRMTKKISSHLSISQP